MKTCLSMHSAESFLFDGHGSRYDKLRKNDSTTEKFDSNFEKPEFCRKKKQLEDKVFRSRRLTGFLCCTKLANEDFLEYLQQRHQVKPFLVGFEKGNHNIEK